MRSHRSLVVLGCIPPPGHDHASVEVLSSNEGIVLKTHLGDPLGCAFKVYPTPREARDLADALSLAANNAEPKADGPFSGIFEALKTWRKK